MNLSDVIWPWGRMAVLQYELDIARRDSEYFREELEKTREELAAALSQIAKFDRDGDGKVGGSKPKAKKASTKKLVL